MTTMTNYGVGDRVRIKTNIDSYKRFTFLTQYGKITKIRLGSATGLPWVHVYLEEPAVIRNGLDGTAIRIPELTCVPQDFEVVERCKTRR
jgi:hypothetical protein